MSNAESGDVPPPRPPHRRPRVRPSLRAHGRRLLQVPFQPEELRRMQQAVRSEFDFRVFCMFGQPGMAPEPGCPRPVRLAGRVFDSHLLRTIYAGRCILSALQDPASCPTPPAEPASETDPCVPAADPLHLPDSVDATRPLLTPLMLDALLVFLGSSRGPLLDMQRVGPTLATLGMEFFLRATDPAAVITAMADELCRQGLLRGPSSQDAMVIKIFGPAFAYAPTNEGKAKVIAEILPGWEPARVRMTRPRGTELFGQGPPEGPSGAPDGPPGGPAGPPPDEVT